MRSQAHSADELGDGGARGSPFGVVSPGGLGTLGMDSILQPGEAGLFRGLRVSAATAALAFPTPPFSRTVWSDVMKIMEWHRGVARDGLGARDGADTWKGLPCKPSGKNKDT